MIKKIGFQILCSTIVGAVAAAITSLIIANNGL
jgi:hypothetical protein